eukprot:TRINITY_DN2728_c0_g1_i1.p1 TRINITY_DN2728_c0_g1~~TRINITY_DN2728_c0_g1_i1.p1  ORF type:complete len:373 (-),score=31.94 TRINITY_DN2728_c0_g1_i1:49-1116(-)
MVQARARRRIAMGAAHPLLDPTLAQYTLAFLRPSLMIRSTCRMFRDAAGANEAEKQHRTVGADAVASIKLIRWAVRIGLHPELAQESCIRCGNLDGLRRLRLLYDLPLAEEHCELAASGGYLELLQFLRQSGCPWSEWTCSCAADGGHLDVLQWSRANGCPWSELTCARAAEEGHLRVLQWARAEGCPWSKSTCMCAAEGGHLEVLQWARANGCPWDESTCSRAAEGGYLDVLQWARANGCRWEKSTCSCAAEGGHLDILQWARANGCPWEEVTCSSAAAAGLVPTGALGRHGRAHTPQTEGIRAPGGAAVGSCQRVPLDAMDVLTRRRRRAFGGAAVGACQRLPVGLGDMCGSR